MSDGFRPSPGAVGDLGNAVVNLTGTILGKLDDAQRASEYHNGVETLRRGLTEFDLQLEQNPEWQKYPELAQQKENELWAQVQTNTKHQGALNDLQQTWQQMRDSHYAAIGNISNRVRVSQYHGDAVARYDSLEKQVEAGTMTEANASSQMEGDMKSMVASGVFDPTDAFKALSKYRAYMQTSEAARKIRTEAKTNGWDAAIAKIPEIAGQYSELKSPGQIDAFTQTMERQRDYAETREKKEAEKVNGDIDLDLSDKWNHMILNDGTVTMNQMQDAIEHQDYKLMQGAQLHRSYTNQMREYIRSEKAGEHKIKGETPEFKALMVKAHSSSDPGPILQEAREAAGKNLIDWTGEFGERAIEDILDKKVTDKAGPFQHLFEEIPAQTSNIGDPTQREKVSVALAYQGAKFKQWISAHMDAGESDMEKEADRRHTLAIQGVVKEAVNTIYPADHTPTYPGTVPAMIPAGGHPPEKVSAGGPSGVATHYYGKAKTGEDVLRDDNGVYYTQDKNGRWIYSKDGKTWQIQ